MGTGLIGFVHSGQPYVPGLGRMASPGSAGSPNRYSVFGNDPVNFGIGNTRALLSSTGQVLGQADYTAWGTALEWSGQTTSLGWQGQSGAYTDLETGLVKLGFRYYAPTLGRFLNRDPSGFAGGMNLYGYCNGDPVNACDASGLDEPNVAQQVLGAVGGVIDAAPRAIGRGLRRGASAGMTYKPGTKTFRDVTFDGSCEAEMVNGRFRGIGNAVANGIDDNLGMMVITVVGGAFDAAGVGSVGTTAEEMAAKEGIKPFEIGTYKDLKKRELVGDQLQVHHIPQGQPAAQVIPHYIYEDGIAIALPNRVHWDLPATSRLKGPYLGSARQLISTGLRDLHNAGVDRETLIELASKIRATYPGVYAR